MLTFYLLKIYNSKSIFNNIKVYIIILYFIVMLVLERVRFPVLTLDSILYEDELKEINVRYFRKEDEDFYDYTLIYDSSTENSVARINYDFMCRKKLILSEVYIPSELTDYAVEFLVENQIKHQCVKVNDEDTILYLTSTDSELSMLNDYLDAYNQDLEYDYSVLQGAINRADQVDDDIGFYSLALKSENIFFLLKIFNSRNPPIPYRVSKEDCKVEFICDNNYFRSLELRLLQYELWKIDN